MPRIRGVVILGALVAVLGANAAEGHSQQLRPVPVSQAWADLTGRLRRLEARFQQVDAEQRALQRRLPETQAAYAACNSLPADFPAKQAIQQLEPSRENVEIHLKILGQQVVRVEGVRRRLEAERLRIEEQGSSRATYDRLIGALIERFDTEYLEPMQAEVVPGYQLLVRSTQAYLDAALAAAQKCKSRAMDAPAQAKTFYESVVGLAEWFQDKVRP